MSDLLLHRAAAEFSEEETRRPFPFRPPRDLDADPAPELLRAVRRESNRQRPGHAPVRVGPLAFGPPAPTAIASSACSEIERPKRLTRNNRGAVTRSTCVEKVMMLRFFLITTRRDIWHNFSNIISTMALAHSIHCAPQS